MVSRRDPLGRNKHAAQRLYYDLLDRLAEHRWSEADAIKAVLADVLEESGLGQRANALRAIPSQKFHRAGITEVKLRRALFGSERGGKTLRRMDHVMLARLPWRGSYGAGHVEWLRVERNHILGVSTLTGGWPPRTSRTTVFASSLTRRRSRHSTSES